VVPACKTLDCVALFTTTTQDLYTLLNLTAKHDLEDPYSRANPLLNRTVRTASLPFNFAVPGAEQLAFFGNEQYQSAFEQTITELEKLGGIKHEIDFSDFIKAAKLLYEGPWVTERYLACQSLIDSNPQALLEVTRDIIAPGKNNTASEVFIAQYKLQACKQKTDAVIDKYDFILTPTTGTIYTIEQVNNDPIQLNSNLGYYTNYMNLLDYASIAVPAGFTSDGLPFGITLVSTAFEDCRLLSYASLLQQSLKLPLGATGKSLPEQSFRPRSAGELLNIVVCGAHMSGLSLNHELLDRDAVLIKQCKSAAHYKLIALPGGPPERPGMIRVGKEGAAIEVEVWQMPTEHFGSFLAGIPHPLGLGKVELDDGSWESGFICESYIETDATDISEYGGWRNYINKE
jgi:allophanate hydrolase